MLLSSSNRKYPPFPLWSYFSVVVWLRCLLHHILSIYAPGKPGICFHYYCAVYDECKYSETFWLADRTRLFVQYTISLSSLCKLIWRHWNYKMPVRYILSSIWVRLSIFSPLSILPYVGLYVFSLHISLVMIEIIYIYIICLIIIIKSEVWTFTHCLGLGHETIVSAVSLSIYSGITRALTNPIFKVSTRGHFRASGSLVPRVCVCVCLSIMSLSTR